MLNGLVGTFEVRGEFDDQLDEYFKTKGGAALKDRLMVVQQVQEKSPGLDGANNTNAMLVNGQWSMVNGQWSMVNYYQMVNQAKGVTTQFWITQAKYNPECANETLTMDVPQQWTVWNNSVKVAHPFHIHQNPFQLLSMSNRTPNEFKHPVWRDTLPLPQAPKTPQERVWDEKKSKTWMTCRTSARLIQILSMKLNPGAMPGSCT